MAASFVGVDIGTGSVKLAYRKGGVVHLVSRTLPENLMGENDVLAPQTLSNILSELRRGERVSSRDVVMVLGESNAFFRHVTLPLMTDAELRLNLPYEFRDYIDEDPSSFAYDYAVDEIPTDDDGKPDHLELYASAASRKLLDDRASMLRKAGFRLKVAIPSEMAYARLLTEFMGNAEPDPDSAQVIIDIGYERVSVYLFQGTKYKASKTIDFGCRDLDMAIADLKGVDRHVASTYKQSNFEGVLDEPDCEAFYDRLCFEINKVINFYRFSNAVDVERMYLLGGGVEIPQLMGAIERSFPIPMETADKIMPADIRQLGEVGSFSLAIAGLLEGEAVRRGA